MKQFFGLFFLISLSFPVFGQKGNTCLSGDCQNGYAKVLMNKGDTLYANFNGYRPKPYIEIHYKNGDIYKGYNSNEMPNGSGILLKADGTRFVGVWKNGKKELTGSLIYKDGSKFYANFHDDTLLGPTLLKNGCIAGDCNYGLGSYVFADGKKYNGSFFGGLKNGKGSFEYSDGRIFNGEFYLDTIQGYGTMRYNDGSYYEGMYYKGKRSGFGTFFNAKTTQKQKGIWKNDQFIKAIIIKDKNECLVGDCKNGKSKIKFGLYSDCPSCIYEGEFKAGNRNGYGQLIYPNGREIQGYWKNDAFLYTTNQENTCNLGDCVNGYGRYDWKSKEMYLGFWKKDKRNFFGKNIFETKNTYIGFWKDDKKSGWGVNSFLNGEIYKGFYKNDWRNGRGSFVFENGNKYVGEFRNDTILGEGIMYYPDGKIERGMWRGARLKKLKENKFACITGDCWYGYGTYISKSGERYIGNWQDSKYNGEGILYEPNGDVYSGEFVKGIKEGYGKQIWANGERYLGFWKNGKIDGRGIYVFRNDSILRAFWREGKFIVKIAKNPNIPKLIWDKPLNNKAIVYSNEVELLFGVISATKLSNIQIYVNNKLKANFVQYDTLPVSMPEYDLSISRKVKLTEGKNEVYLKATNDYGETISSRKIIMYKKNALQSKQALIVACNYNSSDYKFYVENAKQLAKYLKNKNYELKILINPNKQILQNEIRAFGERLLKNQNEGLFYYGGLMKQIDSKNYFVLNIKDISTIYDIQRDGLMLNPLFTEILYGTCPANEIILDYQIAKLKNSLFRLNGEWGLFPNIAPRNTEIYYSAMPGSELGTSVEKNLFFTAFMGALNNGDNFDEAFKKTKKRIENITLKHQIPYFINSKTKF